MRIAFADFCDVDFHVQTVDVLPLGGSQSAACYLARALTRLGHEVFLIGKVSKPGIYDGVTCLSWSKTGSSELSALRLDAAVSIMTPRVGPELRRILGAGARLILWNHHAADQEAAQFLRDANVIRSFDAMAMVSQWQLEQYQHAFGIVAKQMTVMRNAVAPCFANQFAGAANIFSAKDSPPTLAYTSTPFRGLELLVSAMPGIRAAVPGVTLKVFSSMKVYGVDPAKEQAEYGPLYDYCKRMPGVEYIGSVPQPQLAQALRGVCVLAYPNVFPETSCIAVMEAMASGCRIVTSNLAALPETAAGFARLIRVDQSIDSYRNEFIENTVRAVRESASGNLESEAFLQNQVAYANSELTWGNRALQWSDWLQNLKA